MKEYLIKIEAHGFIEALDIWAALARHIEATSLTVTPHAVELRTDAESGDGVSLVRKELECPNCHETTVWHIPVPHHPKFTASA